MSDFAVVIWVDPLGNYTQTVGYVVENDDHITIHNDIRLNMEETDREKRIDEAVIGEILVVPNSMVCEITKLYEHTGLRVIK